MLSDFAGSTIEDVPRGCGPFRFTYTSQDYGANDHQADALGTQAAGAVTSGIMGTAVAKLSMIVH